MGARMKRERLNLFDELLCPKCRAIWDANNVVEWDEMCEECRKLDKARLDKEAGKIVVDDGLDEDAREQVQATMHARNAEIMREYMPEIKPPEDPAEGWRHIGRWLMQDPAGNYRRLLEAVEEELRRREASREKKQMEEFKDEPIRIDD